MLYPLIGLIALIFVLFYSFYLMIYMISLVYSMFMGSPYVKTKTKTLETILQEANLKPNQVFIDLGCGDGIVVRAAVKKYKVVGTGIDINPLLIYRAKIINFFAHAGKITFLKQNIFDADIKKADIIYLFLLPKFLVKLKTKLKNESSKKALIISHGFQIDGWEKYMIKKIDNKPFSTFYYRLHSS